MNADRTKKLFFICVYLCSSAVVFSQTTAPANDDERLMAELANRGLNTLLERAFEVSHVPPERQQGIRSLVALRALSDPAAKLTVAQRQQLISKVVAGIDQALPNLNDPQLLMESADQLRKASLRDVNTIEYWGESAKAQASLRPVAQTIVKLLDKAAAIAQAKVDQLSNSLTGPNDPKLQQLDGVQRLVLAASYTKAMLDYNLCIALPANDPQRVKTADGAIAFLQPYDTPDSNVQHNVRSQIGMLQMAKGDYAKARAAFASVMAMPPQLAPPPTAEQQYRARYFSVVCEVLAKKADVATKGLADLVAWQKTGLPADQATQDGVAAAAAMLQYRIRRLQFDLATDDAAKTQANAAGNAVLIDLVKKRPDLQGIIYEQLMSNLPANVDLKTLDPLLLAALVRKGDEERLKQPTEPIDKAVVQRAIDAAKELLTRKGQSGVDNQIVENSALVVPFLLEKLDQLPQAAEAFLAYIKQFPTSVKNAQLALDNAQAIIARLRQNKATADDAATVAAYEHFLPIAIGAPFNRREFAYEYARRIMTEPGRLKAAVEYFRQVPDDDKRVVQARFYQMVCQQQRLDHEKIDGGERQIILAEFAKLADDVNRRASDALKSATTDSDKQQSRSILARGALLAADVARREAKDPNRTLALLANFESAAAGLPNEKDLLASALYLRVQAYMEAAKFNEATKTLQTLLQVRPGGEGANLVLGLMKKLNEDLDRAREAGDKNQMKTIAQNRAQLSTNLVEWAKTNPDPNIKKFTYRYTVFDASAKQLAAQLQDDPTRKTALVDAINAYRKLQSPENVALYRATIDPKSGIDPNYPDPAVSLGIGLIQYDLGNYAEAQKALGQLLTDRKLGTPTTTVEENGTVRVVENDQYWEATLKLVRCNVALAKNGDDIAKSALDESKNYLKQLYIQWGKGVGGAKWNPEFEKLRAELIPDFKPEDLTATTVPAAAGK